MNQILPFFYYLISSPEIIALIFGGILASFFSLKASFSNDKRTLKRLHVCIFLSGLLVVFSGIYSGYEGQKTSKLLQSKTDKIVILSEKNVGSLTGGDSYVYLMPFIPVGSDMIQFSIVHSGEYTMYDIYINIIDKTKLKKLDFKGVWPERSNKNNIQNNVDPLERLKQWDLLYKNAVIEIDVGIITQYFTKTYGPYKITGVDSNDKTQLYLVQIVARNGGISQHIKAVKIDGNWKYSWKVLSNDGEVLNERKVPEVPLD